MVLAGAGLLYVFGKAVSASAEFEKRMDFFGAVTEASGKQVEKVRNTILDLANTSIYTANDIADGVVELGKAGVGTNKIINGIGKAMVNLGAAADISLTESGQIISSTLAQFHLGAKQAVHVTDLLAGAANASIADIADIGVSLKYVGGIASATGLKLDDVTTAISILAKNGIRGSTAGTSLRQMIVSLGGATKPALAALQELGIITLDNQKAFDDLTKLGVKPASKSYNDLYKAASLYMQAQDAGKVGTKENTKATLKYLTASDLAKNAFYDQKGNIKPLSQVYQILQKALKNTTGAEKAAYLRTIFNNRALAASAILTRAGAKGFKSMSDEMSKTTSAEVAHKRLDNLAGDIKILKSNITTYMIKAGTPLQKNLRSLTQNITKLVQAFGKLPEGTQTAIFQFIGFAGVALTLMGILNIILGTIFKFVAALIKLRAAMVFVIKVARVLGFLIGLIFGIPVGTIALIIAAVLALAAAFIILYKKCQPFHDFVNRIGKEFMDKVGKPVAKAVMATIKWFKKLATDPKAAWQDIKNLAGKMVDAVVKAFNSLKGRVKTGLDQALKSVGNFLGKVVNFFKSLPGRTLKIISSFVKLVLSFFTFKNLGKVLGALAGLVVAKFALLTVGALKILTLGMKLIGAVFSRLPKIIGFVMGYVIGTGIRLWWKFMSLVTPIVVKLVLAIMRFLGTLPFKVGKLMVRAGNALFLGFGKLVAWAIKNGPRLLWALNKWIQKLPGRIAKHLATAAVKFVLALPGMIKAAGDLAQGVLDTFMAIVNNLPGLVWDALQNTIQAFLDMMGAAFDAAKNFAKGLWSGFKKGLGLGGDKPKAPPKPKNPYNNPAGRMGSDQLATYAALSSLVDPTRLPTKSTTVGSVSNTNTQVINNKLTVNNPKPERASTSTKKALQNKVFASGWN
jgi:hypothetical protein